MTVFRATTSFLTAVKAGSIRCAGIYVDIDQAPIGQAGKVEEVTLPLSAIDDTGRVVTLPAGMAGPGGRAAQVTFSVEIAGRFIRLNRECACDAGPALAPVLLALGFTAYSPVGGSLAYLIEDAA
ncbi:MAG: hypothetical protein QFE16_00370 [Pseudomonadota bacterium]|nr:hypothetical protein [Pseudomonadota bacterium]